MKRRTLVLEIAIGAVVLALGVWLAIDPDDPPQVQEATPVAAAPITPAPPPAPTALPTLSVRDRSVLCLDRRCRRIHQYLDRAPHGPVVYGGTPVDADAPLQLDGCTLTLSGKLACGRNAPLDVEITGRSHTYLRAGDRLAWSRAVGWEHPRTGAVHWMPAFPGGIQQLSVGYLFGCVLTREHTVWCWSDPAKPRALVVPANVVEIAVIDPFVLCVRTTSGDVSCTQSERADVACDSDRAVCGSEWDETTISHRFDPLTLVTGRFHRVAVPAAKRLVAAEYLVDIGNVELEHVHDVHAPACTIGMRGEVTCFATCVHGTSTVRVTGMPAAHEVRADLERGYAVTDAGELWMWSTATDDTCRAIDVPAVKAAMPALVQLGEPLYHMGPWPRWETTRCAVTRAGPRCWHVDHAKPIEPFDPSAL